MNSKEMKNIKKPAYAVNLGFGKFAGISETAWYCQYCMRSAKGTVHFVNTEGDYRPVGTSPCNKSPTGVHVWTY